MAEKKMTVNGVGRALDSIAQNSSVRRGQVYATFKTGVLTKDREGNKVVRCDFSIIMDDGKAALLQTACPDVVAEWKQMMAEGIVERVELDGEKLPVQEVECRTWPERAAEFRRVARLERVSLVKVRQKTSSFIDLRISVTRGIDDETWAWLRGNYGAGLWMKLRKAQGNLLEKFLEEESEEEEEQEADGEGDPKTSAN